MTSAVAKPGCVRQAGAQKGFRAGSSVAEAGSTHDSITLNTVCRSAKFEHV